MDIKKVMHAGGFVHENPAYNPNSKKNVVPRYITNENPVGALNGTSAAADFLMRHQDALQNLDYLGDPEKYGRYGVTVSPVGNLDKELADAQSNWAKVGNALAQTLISEVGIGTFKGMSDMLDFVGQTIGISNHDYSNPVSQYLEELQESFKKNIAPIYSDPDRNTIADGGLGNIGWWASNLPSVASSLTLLLPSMGITKGLSMLGKSSGLFGLTRTAMAKAAKGLEKAKLTRAAKWINKPSTIAGANLAVENGLTAALSRTMENYQESRQTYTDVYNRSRETLAKMNDADYAEFLKRNGEALKNAHVDVEDRDAVAKYLAEQSADRTFAMDWANVVFDFVQLYALRNVFTHAPKFMSNAETRKWSRLVKKYPTLSKEQIVQEEAKRSLWARGLERTGDYTFGFGRQIAASASEGVEEAINYIAQQEGVHLGEYLLTGEGYDNKSTNIFDAYANASSRITQDYIQNSQLWDSAFWGVLGGVVFEGLGSQLKRLERTIENRSNKKEGEEEIQKPSWWSLDNTAETERMINEMQSRAAKFNLYKEAVGKIKDAKNPFVPEGHPDAELTSTEQDMYLEMVKNQYIDGMVVDARNNGTLDDLKAYMRSPELRKAFIEKGIVSPEDADTFMADFAARADKVDSMYDSEINNLNYVASDVYRRTGNSMPVEYLQIIASNNVRHRLNLEYYDDIAARYNEESNDIETRLKKENKLDPNTNYRELVRTKNLFNYLRRLKETEEEIDEELRQHPSVLLQIQKEDIAKERQALYRNFVQNHLISPSSLIYAVQAANTTEAIKNEEGKIVNYTVTDKAIIEQLDNLATDFDSFVESLGITEPLNKDAVIGDIQRINKDISSVIDEADKLSELSKASKQLKDNYETLSQIELEQDKERSLLVETEDEIASEMNNIHNVSQEGRKAAISDATNTLLELQEKYKDVDFISVVDRISAGDNTVTIPNISAEDKTRLDNALKVLNFADRINKNLFKDTIQLLVIHKMEQAGVDSAIESTSSPSEVSEDDTATGEISTGNLNPAESSQPSEQENPPQTTSETPTGQENEQNEPFEPQTLRVKLEKQLNGTYKTTNATNDDDTDVTEITSRPDGNYDLNKSVDEAKDDNDFYEHRDNNEYVISRPVINVDNDGNVSVVERGIVGNKPAADPSALPSTGGLEVNPPTAPAAPAPAPTPAVTFDSNAEPIEDPILVIIAKTREFFRLHAKEMRDTGKTYSVSDIRAFINQDDLLNTIDDANRRIEEQFNNFVAAAESAGIKVNKLVNDVIDTLASNIIEARRDRDNKFKILFNDKFKDSLRKLVEAYAKEAGLAKVNGKYLINFESLMRYINQTTDNNLNARLLYNNFVTYITSDEGKKEYIVVDEENLTSENFLKNVLIPEQERRKVIFDTNETDHRINILDFVEDLTNAEAKREYYKAFDKIVAGDTLTVERSGGRILFRHNGNVIGFIGVPRFVDNTQESTKNGWIYDISRTGDIITSKFQDAILALVDDKSTSAENLKRIIEELAFTNPSKERTEELLKKLRRNTAFKKLSPYQDKDATTNELAKGLAHVWKYCYQFVSIENPNEALKASIMNWFTKVADSNAFAIRLITSPGATVTVTDINAGDIVEAVKLSIDTPETDIPLASEAIASENKPNDSNGNRYQVSLGVASKSYTSAFECVKVGNVPNLVPNFSPRAGVTVVVVPAGNGTFRFAQARPILVQDIQRGSQAAAVMTAIKNRIKQLVYQACTEEGEGRAGKLMEFLDDLMSRKGGRSPLLYAAYHDDLDPARGYHGRAIGTDPLHNQTKGNDLNIFDNAGKTNYRGEARRDVLQLKSDDRVVEQLDFVLDNADTIADIITRRIAGTTRFNIGYAMIAGDNGSSQTYSNIMYHDNEGKFHIEIDDTNIAFESFNDFILGQNLVRVNMKPAEDGTSNITRNPDQAFISRPRLKVTTSTPVKESRIEPVTVETSIQEKAVTILNDENETHKGQALARLITNQSTIDSLILNNLLPANVVYDETLEDNAQMKIGTDVIRVGKRWMEMLSIDKHQALRKLIHERLHQILHTDDNLKYRNQLVDVYNEFLKKVNSSLEKYTFRNIYRTFADEETLKKYVEEYDKTSHKADDKNKTPEELLVEALKKYAQVYNKSIYDNEGNIVDETLKDFLEYQLEKYEENHGKAIYDSEGNIINEALEEFLVESLTSVELANFLNNTTSDTGEKRSRVTIKKQSLLQKIFNVLKKLLNINVKDGSLYAKEYNALADIMNNIPAPKQTRATRKTVTETASEIPATGETQERELDEEEEELIQAPSRTTNNYTSDELENMLYDDDNYDELSSTITEDNINDAPSIEDYINAQPIEIQAAQASYIERGEFSIVCK